MLCLKKTKSSNFFYECLLSFVQLKDKLVRTPIIVPPDRNYEFEIMCDALSYVMGAVFGQRRDRLFRVIYYGNRSLVEA